MARLVLGPLLRHVGSTDATVWVETDAACDVEVLDHRARTFTVAGHHYALVCVTGLEAGATIPYEVRLDGERAWPPPDEPPSLIRTIGEGRPLTIAFGSCRVCAPNEGPAARSKDDNPQGRGVDALRALGMRMRSLQPEQWPDLLVLLGDQVYADEVSPGVRELIRGRRDASVPPGETVADFEEYTRLYREAWGEPQMRRLLSEVPSAMIFDDHDVHDDWNTSEAWVRTMRAQGWWDERIVGGFMSYWIYQHLGNLDPRSLDDEALWDEVEEGEDVTELLREFAWQADREVAGARWSFARDLGRSRLVMVDSRAGRVLGPGRRSMVDEEEWRWIAEHATGDVDHLLLGTSLPVLLGYGMHWLEAWNEAVCDGAWGPAAARVGEALRQAGDLEHWSAFDRSFRRLWEILAAAGAGQAGAAPASITVLSGDVHHAYLAEVAFPRSAGVRSAVWQAVCSPFRNPLDARERLAIRLLGSPAGHAVTRALARAAGVQEPPVRWRLAHRAPWFDNQIATLRLDGRSARLTIERVGDSGELERAFAHDLA